jgi:hypothetical protein
MTRCYIYPEFLTFIASYHLSSIHIPFMLPATASTAFFNLKDSLATISFSSSQHSAMNVAVSATNPATDLSVLVKYLHLSGIYLVIFHHVLSIMPLSIPEQIV